MDKVIAFIRGLPILSVRRALRVTLVAAGTFSSFFEVAHNPVAAFFATFGAVVLLVYVEFLGPKRQRFEQHVSLLVITLSFVVLGTLCSQVLWVAVAATVVLSFCVLMTGVVSSSFAGTTSAMLISFLLPVAFKGPVSSIPDRMLGWSVAGVLSLGAIALILPAASSEPFVDVTAGAVREISRYLSAIVGMRKGGASDTALHEYADAASATETMRTAFFTASFRPAGLSASARGLIKVIEWTLELDLLFTGNVSQLDDLGDEVRALLTTCSNVLAEVAASLTSSRADTGALEASLRGMREKRALLEDVAVRSLHRYDAAASAASTDHDGELLVFLDQSFRADVVADTVENLGNDAVQLVAARGRNWWQQLLGLEATGSDSRLRAARRRLRSHLSLHSVWLHNSARGALGLGVSVLVAYEFGVQHAFWVVFGTLAVLRSNALSTGQTVVKALTGTIEGIIIGSIIIALLGTHQTVFWILLPFAVCFTGFAPSAISFAAGQAAFTMTILIVFNIVEPDGWQLGVIRVEDVALGCGVSLVVGLSLWPRGATGLLRRSIADGVSAGVTYLEAAVTYGLSRCDPTEPEATNPQGARDAAQAAARRLDDAFREYLSERGAKSVSLADVSVLIAGVTAIRTTADNVHVLWGSARRKGPTDRAAIEGALGQATDSVSQWFNDLSRAIASDDTNLGEPPDFSVSPRDLVILVRRELSDAAGNGTTAAFKIVWTDDYLRQLLDLERRMLPVVEKILAARAQTAASTSWRAHVSLLPSKIASV
ncbi:MAG: FUSC family protein [Acidimicrobiales bacterium]